MPDFTDMWVHFIPYLVGFIGVAIALEMGVAWLHETVNQADDSGRDQ